MCIKLVTWNKSITLPATVIAAFQTVHSSSIIDQERSAVEKAKRLNACWSKFMKRSPSEVSNGYSAGQLTPTLYKIQTCIHNLPLNPTLNNLGPFRTPAFFLFNIKSNISFSLRLDFWSRPFNSVLNRNDGWVYHTFYVPTFGCINKQYLLKSANQKSVNLLKPNDIYIYIYIYIYIVTQR